MSNNFPSVPNAFVLSSVSYSANFASVAPASPFTGVALQMSGGLMALGGPGGLMFQFATPGQFGTFDQTAAETAVKKVVTDVCQLIADLEGKTLAQVQATVPSISRTWSWVDGSGNNASFVDTLAYP